MAHPIDLSKLSSVGRLPTSIQLRRWIAVSICATTLSCCKPESLTKITNQSGYTIELTIYLNPPHKINKGLVGLFEKPSFYSTLEFNNVKNGDAFSINDWPRNIYRLLYRTTKSGDCLLDQKEITNLMRVDSAGHGAITLTKCNSQPPRS